MATSMANKLEDLPIYHKAVAFWSAVNATLETGRIEARVGVGSHHLMALPRTERRKVGICLPTEMLMMPRNHRFNDSRFKDSRIQD